MNQKVLLFLLGLCSILLAVTVIPHESPKQWNDTTRVAIIWNDGTGNDEFPDDWKSSIQIGDLGQATKDFVSSALYHLKDANVKEYHGMMNGWDDVDLESMKDDFNNKYPHVIIYVNAGYEWGQKFSSSLRPKNPYNIITSATEKGIGIVAIGDDAAYDAKKIFPLTGPGGTGVPIQYDSEYPYMGGAVDYPSSGYYVTDLDIVIENDDEEVDAGLLWKVPDGNLQFKEYEKDGRGQSDADIWDVDTDRLDDYFIVGFQRARINSEQWYDGGVSSYYIGNTPSDEIIPSASTYKEGASYYYNALAGLQDGNHRIVMIGYQPQYLVDEDLSSQIVYNAVYWASKAHEVLKISTPIADPDGGAVQTINKVSLTVTYPKNSDLYDIYYTLDGSTPDKNSSQKYTSSFELGTKSEAVTLKAIAFSKDDDWIDSDMLVIEYTYEGGPVVDSAHFQPAPIADFSTSKREDDTLIVFFNTKIKDITTDNPFNFKDKDGTEYDMKLKYIRSEENTMTFAVTEFIGKGETYLPEDEQDSLIVDPDKGIESTDGVEQDGTNNSYGFIRLLPPSKKIDIKGCWIDAEESDQSVKEIFESIGVDDINYEEGVLLSVDPRTPLSESEYEKFDLDFVVMDPVGNIITDDSKCFQKTILVSGRPQLFAVWNGTNDKGRAAAASIMITCVFTDHEGAKHNETIFLSLPVSR